MLILPGVALYILLLINWILIYHKVMFKTIKLQIIYQIYVKIRAGKGKQELVSGSGETTLVVDKLNNIIQFQFLIHGYSTYKSFIHSQKFFSESVKITPGGYKRFFYCFL